MIKKVVLFLVLTIWIVFVSLSANIFYSPDTFKQHELVFECMTHARDKKKIDPNQFVHTFIYPTGGYYEVLLSMPFSKPSGFITCNFDRDGKLNFIM